MLYCKVSTVMYSVYTADNTAVCQYQRVQLQYTSEYRMYLKCLANFRSVRNTKFAGDTDYDENVRIETRFIISIRLNDKDCWIICYHKFLQIWEGITARKEDKKGAQGFDGNTWGKEAVMNLGTDRRKILKWIFKKLAGKAWNELVWLTTRTGGGYL